MQQQRQPYLRAKEPKKQRGWTFGPHTHQPQRVMSGNSSCDFHPAFGCILNVALYIFSSVVGLNKHTYCC